MRRKRIKTRKKRNYIFVLLCLFLVGLTIGYAALTSNLNISGSSMINNATWDIHFENVVDEGNIVPTTAATINAQGNTVSYTVTLNKPGDYYEFTVDAVNAGTINAMVDSVSSKLNGTTITTLPSYLEYSVTYEHGGTISSDQALYAGDSVTYKVHVAFKEDINPSDLPSTTQTLNFSFSVNFIQAINDFLSSSTYLYRIGSAQAAVGDGISVIYLENGYDSYDPYEVLAADSGTVLLRYDLGGGSIIQETALGFLVNGRLYYLNPEDSYDDNVDKLEGIFGTASCVTAAGNYRCADSDTEVEVQAYGDVSAHSINASTEYACYANTGSGSWCMAL